MRVIDADALKENIENWYALVNEWGQTGITLSHDDIIGKIDNQPTVDVFDEIRNEIEQVEINGHIRDVECFRAGINTVLNVIEKYRGDMR